MIYKRSTKELKINNTGLLDVTKNIQELIDDVAAKKGVLVINKGTYLVSNLFLDNDMELVLEKGAVILATTKEENYKISKTRVAGIEMDWFLGIINCLDKKNVKISGEGIIDGNGSYWWEKYWGVDQKGGMRKEYDEKGLRFACDYDCMRPRNILISNSENVTIENITLRHSGFWNLHVLYSKNILIEGVNIESDNENSPSTDGIDIDSSCYVVIKKCITNCNDDSICIKSGRDSDGIRINKPSHNILITDCKINRGFGITIGSEVSGGISNVRIQNIEYNGTDCGFRIKSSLPRGGYIKDIFLENLYMHNVKYLFHIFLNWNPDYSICKLPLGYNGQIKESWKKLLEVSPGLNNKTAISNISIKNVCANYSSEYEGISRIFNIVGYSDKLIEGIAFENCDIKAKEYGIIEYVKRITFNNVSIDASTGHIAKNDSYDNR